jgi:hypothetical protein
VTRFALVGRVLGAVATLVLVVMFVPPSRSRIDRIVVVGLAVYAGFLVRSEFGVGVRPEAVAPPPPSYGELSPADEQDVRLARLDASLVRATESGEQFAKVTAPMLRRLVTERLRAKQGIDVTADPAGARRLMGEELWQIFAAPPEQHGPVPPPERLRHLVDRLERL